MFKEVGSNLRVYCDTESRALRVQINIFAALPQYKAQWSEVAAFTDETRWHKSPYAANVVSESAKDTIAWFWHDLSQTETEKAASTRGL